MDEPLGGHSPLDLLGALGTTVAELRPGLRLIEIYTTQRLLTLLWFGDVSASEVSVLLPGGMGGFAGPARGLYLRLGDAAVARDRGAIVVSYRKPGDLERSLLDTAAAVDWSMREGGRAFVFVGHSFGGAIAVQAATMLGRRCAGVVTLATQSAGCENADQLGDTPLLLVHGDRDQILPLENSALVRSIAGKGEFRVVAGAGHGLETDAGLVDTLTTWIDQRFAGLPAQQ